MLLSRKRKAFRDGNLADMRNLQKEIKREIWVSKIKYKEKIETQLRRNNLGSTWDSLKTITGIKADSKRDIQLNDFQSDAHLAQSFNDFYIRFDINHSELRENLLFVLPVNAFFNEHNVNKCLKCINPPKSPGPDNISGRFLKVCAKQLSLIFSYVFNMSSYQQRVPSSWRKSTVVPIAKCTNPKTLNDLRPVALT